MLPFNGSLKNGIISILILTSIFSCKKEKQKDIVASIGDNQIQMHQLDALIQNQLYESLYGIYYKRRIALEELIAEQVITQEVLSRGISKDSLLKIEIESQITEKNIHQFIKDNKLEAGIIDRNNPSRIIPLNSKEGEEALLNGLKKKLTENWISLLREKHHVTTKLLIPLSPKLSVTGVKKHSRGNLNSEIEVLIFSDFECISCQQHHDLFNEIYLKYKNQLRFSYAHLSTQISLPLLMAECSSNENNFWQIHDFIFNNTPKDTADYITYLKTIGINEMDFKNCFTDHSKIKSVIDSNFKISNKLGIFTTPTILIDNRIYYGELNKASLEEYIEYVLPKTY